MTEPHTELPVYRIELNLPGREIGQNHPDENRRIDSAVAHYQRGHPCLFREWIHRQQWQRFAEAIGTQPGVIGLPAPLPESWLTPPAARILVWDGNLHQTARALHRERARYPVQYRRSAQSFEWDFLLPYGTWQAERESLVQHLEGLGVLQHSLYSRPAESLVPLPVAQVQPDPRRSEPARRIPAPDGLTPEQERFQHHVNVGQFHGVAQRVHCWVAVDNYCINPEFAGTISEKVLYPVLLGIPFIYVGNPEQIRTLNRLGFEPAEPARSTERSVVEQMLWLRELFRRPDLAQSWQELQGERLTRNLAALRRLAQAQPPQNTRFW
jgi:hypothetical protein